MTKYIIVFICSVFISSVSQIILKLSAEKKYESKWKEYLNLRVLTAYAIFFLSSLLTVFAYKYVPLSMGPVLEACGYIFVAVMGYLFLHEKIGRRKLVGLGMILAGIMIFNL